jgi:hypothetical protein
MIERRLAHGAFETNLLHPGPRRWKKNNNKKKHFSQKGMCVGYYNLEFQSDALECYRPRKYKNKIRLVSPKPFPFFEPKSNSTKQQLSHIPYIPAHIAYQGELRRLCLNSAQNAVGASAGTVGIYK